MRGRSAGFILFHAMAARLLKATLATADEKWAGTLHGIIRDFIRTDGDRLLAAGGPGRDTLAATYAQGRASDNAGRVSGEDQNPPPTSVIQVRDLTRSRDRVPPGQPGCGWRRRAFDTAS